MPSDSRFLFTVCQTGAEAALKKELARAHPELRFAYSRPGFVTFRLADDKARLDPAFELRSVFARAYGLSLGKVGPGSVEPVLELGRALRDEAAGGIRPRLHVWERDQHFPGDEPPGFDEGAWARAARSALGPATDVFERDAEPRAGERVVDLVAVEPDEWWYGYHVHHAAHSRAPGGKPPIRLPAEAPSRAYVKLEEALFWSGARLKEGDVAVEIGSAPGGASYALLERGLQVVGIDPGEMAPAVLGYPGRQAGKQAFLHIRKPVAQVPREHLPASVQWLLLDMNVEPRISLFAVDRLATRLRDTLLGLFLTVKLNQWKMADEIPYMLEHVRAMGFEPRATQLASNRQEILIHGLSPRGMKRATR